MARWRMSATHARVRSQEGTLRPVLNGPEFWRNVIRGLNHLGERARRLG